MSLSRTQIELLITARNQAQAAFDGLNKQVKTLTGETQGASQAMGGLDQKVKTAGVGATATGVAFGMLAERVARGLVGAFKDTIDAANRLDAGLIGLSSVANAFGQGADRAKEAAKQLAADGLMSVGDAATGLKNLLAAGFNLDQAVELMGRFKDSAAFGRQAALTFGDAIRSATEGIKNGNSILVDNAGVTKNLSVMLTEAGLSAQDLGKASSDVNVRMAIYNGIIRETKAQTGDAAKLLETAAGKQAKFNAQVEIAQQQIGKALQPALGAMLQTLTPLAQLVGNNAQVFVHLAAAVAAVVVPLAAAKAAAAIGLTPALAGLAKEATTVISVFRGVRSIEDFRAGIQLAGEAAGLTTAKLGALGTAAAVAAAAFVGWQIGKVIDQFTGLSGAVERATVSLFGWSDAAQVAGAKQDVIQRAISQGAAATITYAQAIEYNGRMEAIRAAQFDKSAAAQLKRVDAELALGRITQEQANAQKAALDAETQAATVRANRLKLTDAAAVAEKKFRDEVAATGYSQAELVAALKKDEDGFKAWAKQVQLSDETMARLKDQLQQSTAAQKKAEEQAKKHREAQAELAAVTKTLSDSEMTRIDNLARQGASEKAIAELTGIHEAAVRKYLEALKDQKEAEADLRDFQLDRLKAWTEANQKAAAAIMDREKARMDASTKQIADLIILNGEYQDKLTEQSLTGTKLHLFQLDRQYRAEVANLGQRTAANAAFWDKAKAQIDTFYANERDKATGFWKAFVPEAQQTLTHLQTAVNGSFSQMILGAKSFSQGWKDIWGSMKAAALNILNEILSAFLNRFLKGMLGAMSGQKGAFAGAFAGMFGGGGGAAAGGAVPGGAIPSQFTSPGLGSTAPGGAAGGGFWSGTGGGLVGGAGVAVGAGFTGYQLGGQLGKGKGAAAGALSGAATGAMVGSIVPGLGTAIGAGVGALAGAIGGWFGGKSKDKKENQAATDQIKAYQAELLKTYGSLDKIDQIGKAIGVDLKGAWGDQSKAGLEHFKGLMDEFVAKQQALDAAVQKYGISWTELGPAVQKSKIQEMTTQLLADMKALQAGGVETTTVLKKMAPAYNDLVQAAVQAGQKIPPEMVPVLKQMAELGLLTDQTKKALLGLGTKETVDWRAMEQAAKDFGIELSALGPGFQQAKLDEEAARIYAAFETLKKGGADVGGVLVGMSDEIGQLVADSLKFGTEMPANMKPLIDRLVETGKLVDADGNKITDVSKLKFAEPVEAGFDKIVAAIERLGDILTGDLPADAAEGAGRVNAELGKIRPPKLKIPVEWGDPGDMPTYGGSHEAPEGGAAQGVMANRPGLVLFGEGGETEVGGPASFFRRVFEELGIGTKGSQPGAGGGVGGGLTIGPFYISGLTSASELADVTEKKTLPMILDALRVNRRGALTDLKTIMGV